MNCACCGRSIKPSGAIWANGRAYGPKCGVKVGIVVKVRRKAGRFPIFKRVEVQDEGQGLLFEYL